MSDRALKNAEVQRDQLLAERNDLKARIADIEKRMAAADAFIYQWHQFADDKPVENVNVRVTGVSVEVAAGEVGITSDGRAKGNSNKEDVAAEARRIVVELNKPVPRADLFALLVARGFVLKGSDPQMVLSTMLWRAGKAAGIVNLKNRGYWKAEADWPEARYFPSLSMVPEIKAVLDDLLTVQQGDQK